MQSTTESSPQTKFSIDEEELRQLNQSMIQSTLITPDHLYVDLRLIKDYNIGCLLSFLKERKADLTPENYEALYKQIIQSLPDYANRKHDDILDLFPFMKVTTEQLQTRLSDEKYAAFIFHHAPITKFMTTLQAQLFVNVNHSAVVGKRNAIEIVVNSYPLRLDEAARVITGSYLSSILKVNIKMLYLDPKHWTFQDMHRYDEIYTYYLKELLDANDIRDAYSTLKFIGKRLFAAKLFNAAPEVTADIATRERITKSHLDILTQFYYLQAHLFSPEIEKGQT